MNLQKVAESIQPDVVIDVGANIGNFYKEAKELWPDAKYLLVEGNSECQPALEELGVDYSIAVLSDLEKEVTFYTRKNSPCCTGASYLREKTQFYFEDNAIPQKIVTRTLDEVAGDLILPGKKVLLKIDSQGSELDVLMGGKAVLNHTGAIIIEVSFVEYNEGAPLCNVVDAFMIDKGFVSHGSIGEICHPITQAHIQSDILYIRK